jgi:hypothetical protein
VAFKFLEAFVEFTATGLSSIDDAMRRIREQIGNAQVYHDAAGKVGGALEQAAGAIGSHVGTALGGPMGAAIGAAAGATLGTSLLSAAEGGLNRIRSAITEIIATGERRSTEESNMAVAMGGTSDSASGSASRNLIDRTEAMFAGTEVGTSAAKSGVQRLITGGNTNDEAIRMMERLGAVAILTKSNVDSLAEAYEHARIRNFVTMRSMQAMPEAVANELKKMYHAPTDEVFQMMLLRDVNSMQKLEEAINIVADRGMPALRAQQESATAGWARMWVGIERAAAATWDLVEKGLGIRSFWLPMFADIGGVLGELGQLFKDLFPAEELEALWGDFGDIVHNVLLEVKNDLHEVVDIIAGVNRELLDIAEAATRPVDTIMYGVAWHGPEKELENARTASRGQLQSDIKGMENRNFQKTSDWKDFFPKFEDILKQRGMADLIPAEMKPTNLPEQYRPQHIMGGYEFTSLAGLAEKMQQEAVMGGDVQERIASDSKKAAQHLESIDKHLSTESGGQKEESSLGDRLWNAFGDPAMQRAW